MCWAGGVRRNNENVFPGDRRGELGHRRTGRVTLFLVVGRRRLFRRIWSLVFKRDPYFSRQRGNSRYRRTWPMALERTPVRNRRKRENRNVVSDTSNNGPLQSFAQFCRFRRIVYSISSDRMKQNEMTRNSRVTRCSFFVFCLLR